MTPAGLDRDLPVLRAGRADLVLVAGHRDAGTPARSLLVGDVRHPLDADGLRRDGGRRGFWSLVPVPPSAEGALDVVLEGDPAAPGAPLGRIRIGPAPGRAAPTGRPDDVVVCMATHEPDPELLRVQLDSLRAQDDPRWRCVISDDGSSPASLAVIAALIDGDDRFALHAGGARVGFYRNFERALELVPADARLVALCDQDDRWHPDKLSTLRAALGEGVLAYSDQRLTDPAGGVLRETMWRGRANNATDLTAMLAANTVTGAATLFRAELLDVLLPFPDTPGFQFHDHWLGVAALATGTLSYVDRPLYDYVQHAGAVFGDVATGARPPRVRQGPAAVLRGWRGAFFYGHLPRDLMARLVLLRAPARVTAAKRAELEAWTAAGRSPAALARLAVRPIRTRGAASSTLGTEAGLAGGIAWRWLAGAAARVPALARGPLADAGPPPAGDFAQPALRRWRAEL